MRGLLPGLETPHPLGSGLPAIYQEDELGQRFLSALDEVLAPVLATLDNLAAYLDPRLAPVDFLGWLAGWVGLVLDENWPAERQRAAVAGAAELYRWRGTARGLAAQVALSTGVQPEIEESGATAWSATPGADIPGDTTRHVTVRVRLDVPSEVDLSRLDALVAVVTPADVTHWIEVTGA